MTTMDLIAGTANAFYQLEDRLQSFVRWAIVPFVDDIVDVGRWLWRARMRRKQRKAGAHRNNDRSVTVWEIYDRMTDEELERSTFDLARVPGAHRDRRGWRHAPATWKQIPVWESEREREQARWAEARDWEATVDQLMADIRRMLDNPPEPERLHACKHCLCPVPA